MKPTLLKCPSCGKEKTVKKLTRLNWYCDCKKDTPFVMTIIGKFNVEEFLADRGIE